MKTYTQCFRKLCRKVKPRVKTPYAYFILFKYINLKSVQWSVASYDLSCFLLLSLVSGQDEVREDGLC